MRYVYLNKHIVLKKVRNNKPKMTGRIRLSKPYNNTNSAAVRIRGNTNANGIN